MRTSVFDLKRTVGELDAPVSPPLGLPRGRLELVLENWCPSYSGCRLYCPTRRQPRGPWPYWRAVTASSSRLPGLQLDP